jgi:hypothetical protein
MRAATNRPHPEERPFGRVSKDARLYSSPRFP